MSAASFTLPDPPQRSKKRRHSALEILTISPSRPKDAKRPRILEVNDDRRSAASSPSNSSPDSPTAAAAEDLADAPPPSSSASEAASPAHKPAFATRITWQPLPPIPPPAQPPAAADDLDSDADADYTSSSGPSDGEESTSSSSASSGSDSESGSDADSSSYEDALSSPAGGAHFSHAPATPAPRPWATHEELPSSADLRARLRAFLPAMGAANTALEAEGPRGAARRGMELEVPQTTIYVTPPSDADDADGEASSDGDERVIEMELGLGVLEERRPGDESDDESSSSSSASSGDEADVLGRLMGRPRTRPGIEVMGDAA